MYVCMYVCMYVWMYVCMYVYVYVCMYVYMYVYMYVCMCMYVSVNIYNAIQTLHAGSHLNIMSRKSISSSSRIPYFLDFL